MVDLYYALYGSKRPLCLPQAELAAMFKPQKVTTSSSFANVEDEKPKKMSLNDDEIDEKPIIIDTTIQLSPKHPPFDDQKLHKSELIDNIELSPIESNPLKRDAIEAFDSSSVKIEPDELELIEVIVSVRISYQILIQKN